MIEDKWGLAPTSTAIRGASTCTSCGDRIDTDIAVRSVLGSEKQYFCDEDCREDYMSEQL